MSQRGPHLSCSLVWAQCLAQGGPPVRAQPMLVEQIRRVWEEEGARDGAGMGVQSWTQEK